ncbi:MAG: tRNA (adenosine(37)-N6)-threonylcarbamoyltransferase complex dimerization subunit type 1 TsaB [Desulfurispora sp.]|uniref:tRNA (adenosine(37)-N6)-threonylcarbamoyltransferase complex dimerization subunit type 1 TsaB n=1 Tax=Desulfurispora sp. TaxID=3014275 RepID=UPI00404AC7B7
MNLLALETATPVASVAVYRQEQLQVLHSLHSQRTHSVQLGPMIKSALSGAGLQMTDLQGLAVSSGPGSFTGLRIGLAVAKTLGQVLNIPLCGVSTLDALAYRLRFTRGYVCAMLYARKNEVYYALYSCGGGQISRLTPLQAAAPQQVAGELAGYGEEVLCVGDGVLAYGEIFSRVENLVVSGGALNLPGADCIAELGLAMLREGCWSSAFDLMPEYVRLSEAEARLQAQNAGGI